MASERVFIQKAFTMIKSSKVKFLYCCLVFQFHTNSLVTRNYHMQSFSKFSVCPSISSSSSSVLYSFNIFYIRPTVTQAKKQEYHFCNILGRGIWGRFIHMFVCIRRETCIREVFFVQFFFFILMPRKCFQSIYCQYCSLCVRFD